MTSIVGIRCKDGVVIGSDTSATFGDERHRTIEQETERKIEIIGNAVIVAGTGYVGHHQRFVALVRKLHNLGTLRSQSQALDKAKLLSQEGVKEFAATHVQRLEYGSLVAFEAEGQPVLCEYPLGQLGAGGFQPEIKMPDDKLWFASIGSGQQITDPFLALVRKIFWPDGPPTLKEGKFMALWALKHACEVNPGGIKEPIKIAVLEKKGRDWKSSLLTEAEQAEAEGVVTAATEHFRDFRKVLLGEETQTQPPPEAPPAARS
jgi:hypothetical protein